MPNEPLHSARPIASRHQHGDDIPAVVVDSIHFGLIGGTAEVDMEHVSKDWITGEAHRLGTHE